MANHEVSNLVLLSPVLSYECPGVVKRWYLYIFFQVMSFRSSKFYKFWSRLQRQLEAFSSLPPNPRFWLLQYISDWNLFPVKVAHRPVLFLVICLMVRRWNFKCYPGCEICPLFCFHLFIFLVQTSWPLPGPYKLIM